MYRYYRIDITDISDNDNITDNVGVVLPTSPTIRSGRKFSNSPRRLFFQGPVSKWV